MTMTTGGSVALTWMAYATLVGAAIAVSAWGVARWQRAAGRPTRFVWLAAMVAMVLIPLGVAIRPRVVREVPRAPMELPAPVVRAAPMAPVTRVRDVAAVAWGLGSAAVMLSIVGGVVALAYARRRGAIASWFGTPVLETDDVGPGAAPWGHPAILVPRSLRQLPEPAAQLLLAHEGEHVAAGDPRLLLGATALLVVMPWNLPLWWCLRRLRTAIECDCDARVLRRGAPLGAYASLLLDLVVPRSRPLPALLSLANSASQLRSRIDAMTTTPSLTPARRAATGLLVILAGVAACETRMPAPVAPVADYIVKDGQASPVVIAGDNRDSVRTALVEGVSLNLSTADTSTSPVLVVRDANNTVIHSGRMDGARDSVLAGFSPEGIASVEVIKGRDVLPEGARGGMIVVRLKPGVTWQAPSSRAPSTVMGRPITGEPGGVRIRVRADSLSVVERPVAASGDSGMTAIGRVRVGTSTRDGRSVVELSRPSGADTIARRPSDARAEPVVSLIDAEGRELWSGRGMGREVNGVSTMGPFRVALEDIARVEVLKGPSSPEGGLIQVHLKAGAKPVKP
ncbi:MAG: hypothetical protein JNJ98_02305 [Gemmatimonadetes bacterium]|nr:hypothetical protein [Gemmatimonadota bacterium]